MVLPNDTSIIFFDQTVGMMWWYNGIHFKLVKLIGNPTEHFEALLRDPLKRHSVISSDSSLVFQQK